jgi:hypothetical protein
MVMTGAAFNGVLAKIHCLLMVRAQTA